jgi:hypothetical protein
MGMDVIGKNPSSETGEYFRANVWWWRPIAEISIHFAPEVCAKCEHWGSNDGDGLDAEGSKVLAEALQGAIEKGLVGDYIKDRERQLAALPLVPCEFCKGTGVRTDDVGIKHGLPETMITAEYLAMSRFAENPESHPRFGQKGSCNGCHGAGNNPDWRTRYPASLEAVQEWVAFLKDCGGFEIC